VTVGVTVTAETAATAGRNVPLDPGDGIGEDDANRWRVLRHIADGGFSSVYEVEPATPVARLRHGAVTRALKCLWGTPAELTAIGGEAEKMAAVDGHENVLGLVTSFRFDLPERRPAHYVGLVLELAAEDLPRFAARVKPSERAWAGVFEQVAAGLEHIHARRIVHGDIKPTNILRIGGRFAIADFGVSAPLESTRSAGIGLARTIAFWPPESASQGVLGPDGVRLPPAEGWRATQQGDVWALAVSMHRLLTGRHITPGTTPEQQYELVCLGKYSIDDRLGPGWRRLLGDCLRHDPAERAVSTAADLRARLSELALGDDYAGVAWPDGQPRVVAVLDLGRAQPAVPAAEETPRTAVESAESAEPAEPAPQPAEPAAQQAGTLVLYLDREGGRVHGAVLPGGGLLLAATRHLVDVAVPSLAQQARDSQRAVVRLADDRVRTRAPLPPDDAGPSTVIVDANDMELTRELSVAVADMTRERDEIADDRDRLRRQYTDLARRLERLERDREQRARAIVDAPTAVLHPVRPDAVTTAPVRSPGRSGVPPRPVPPVVRPRRRGHPVLRATLVLLVLLVVAVAVGIVAVGLATHHAPMTVLHDLVDAVRNRTG
jgi:Protein kinase domain